jgi:hypothetical protein
MYYGPRTYISKLSDSFEWMFGEKPRHYSSPLKPGDHPEVDTSALLDHLGGIKQYQSLIGSPQWAVQLGRLDVTTAVMTLSSFRAAPRVGHLNRAKRLIGYLVKTKNAAIRIRTLMPDLSSLPKPGHNWDHTVYRGAKEMLSNDVPIPLGNPIQLSSFVDANLYHDLITGRSVTGVLHLVNGTPFDWYSKKQSTVETATYHGSEFVAARTAIEQIIANRIAFRYLGVEVIGPTHLFGDNESVITSGTIPQSTLNKRHVARSFHRVRESIAAGIVNFHHVRTKDNPADVLSKHWGYSTVSHHLHELLFRSDCANEGTDDKPPNDGKVKPPGSGE